MTKSIININIKITSRLLLQNNSTYSISTFIIQYFIYIHNIERAINARKFVRVIFRHSSELACCIRHKGIWTRINTVSESEKECCHWKIYSFRLRKLRRCNYVRSIILLPKWGFWKTTTNHQKLNFKNIKTTWCIYEQSTNYRLVLHVYTSCSWLFTWYVMCILYIFFSHIFGNFLLLVIKSSFFFTHIIDNIMVNLSQHRII